MSPPPAISFQVPELVSLRFELEERYRNHAGYVAAVRVAADHAVAAGFLLRRDADDLIAQAGNEMPHERGLAGAYLAGQDTKGGL